MAANENSFDVASEVSMPEVANAIQQALKEVTTRYDLKNSHSAIELDEKEKKIALASQDDYKLKAVTEILQQKLVKRGVSLKALTYGTVESASGGTVRQSVTLQSGIVSDKAREIVRIVKDSKKKVQATIQGEVVRIAGKDRDTLQEVIALLRGHDFGIDLQFTNFRSQ
jgi:cyclic-di-GMP-binding protein